MKNSYKFFANKECIYYPCHKMPNDSKMNCLFCYCPLYSLGKDCGGIFEYGGDGSLKMCMDCHLPHEAEYYDVIIKKLQY